MPATEWAAARAAMLLDPEVTNLNCGSWGPTPRPVFERVTQLRRRLAAEPMDFFLRQLPPLLWAARERLAGFLGGDPRRLIFTQNVSASVNLVASSLRLASPGEILLTDHEYGAMHWCWQRAARKMGLTLRTFPLPTAAEDPAAIVEAAAAAMSRHTRLFFFSHVLSPTGLVLPAKELCAEARRRGIPTVVDGAHAPAFADVDLAAIGGDFYGANCHKWLLAPIGSGFLHLGPGAEDRLEPMQVSWGYHNLTGRGLDELDEYGSTARLRRLEFEGTRDCCPWLAVPEAIDFQAALGFDRIRGRMRQLAAHVRRRLDWLTPATPSNPVLSGAMTAFRIPDLDPAGLRVALWERRIEVPVIERPERLLVRVSTHFFNTEDEVDRLAAALAELLPR